MLDVITPNETELSVLTGGPAGTVEEIEQSAKLLLQKGVRNVVVTLGARGSLIVNQNGALLVPARKVSAVDTTGAGDCFNGVLAVALSAGMPLRKLCSGQSGRFYQRNPQRCLDFHAYFGGLGIVVADVLSGRYVLRGGGLSMERIILDTDIGTDVDDVMAVALAAISPELKVEGITTVYGDVDLRAKMVTKVLHMLGREDIPVMAGSRDVLLRNREIWWLGP